MQWHFTGSEFHVLASHSGRLSGGEGELNESMLKHTTSKGLHKSED